MAAVRSDILRCGVRVVCEIMIAELKEILLRKQQKKLLQMKQNNLGSGQTSTVHKGSSSNVQKKQMMEEERKLAKRKMTSDFRRKKSGKPQPITMVSVQGITTHEPPSANDDHSKSEIILPDDPLGNIQIKQEIEDNDSFTFEEHFEDMILPSIKTEVKDELEYNDPDELLEGTMMDSSSCDTFEDGNLRKKPKLEEDFYRPTQSGISLTPEKSTQKFPEKSAQKFPEKSAQKLPEKSAENFPENIDTPDFF